jgi:flagellar protein FlaG
MSLDVGPMRFQPPDRRDVFPAAPPAPVLAEVDAAWRRAGELAAQNRELHFTKDPSTGRVVIEVRTLDGKVLRQIPPAKALAVMAGEEL